MGRCRLFQRVYGAGSPGLPGDCGCAPGWAKGMVGLADGCRESTESWRAILRDLKERGLTAPIFAVGDGNLGFWGALRDVWQATKEQRCWKHRLANALDKLPKRLQTRAKGMLRIVKAHQKR